MAWNWNKVLLFSNETCYKNCSKCPPETWLHTWVCAVHSSILLKLYATPRTEAAWCLDTLNSFWHIFRCLSNTLFQFYISVIVIYFTNPPPPFLVCLLSFSNYCDSLTIPNWAYKTEFSFIQKQLWNVSTKSVRLLIHLVTSRNVIEFYVHLHLIGTLTIKSASVHKYYAVTTSRTPMWIVVTM